MTVVLATGVCWHSGLTGLTARAGLSSAAPAPTDTSTHPPHGTTHLAHGTIKYTNILMEYKISGLHRRFAPFYCPSDTLNLPDHPARKHIETNSEGTQHR